MSDIIYTPPASSGGGGQNPTSLFIPVNNGTSNFVDSNIINDVNNYLVTRITGGDYFGYNIDFNNYTILLGDFNYTSNGTLINLDDNNQYILTAYQGNDIGLKLDFSNRIYYLGDFDYRNQGVYLMVDDNNPTITTYSNATPNGISLDFTNLDYFLGDFSGIGGNTHIRVKDPTKQIVLFTNGGQIYTEANQLVFSGSLTTGSFSGNSGQHLQVTINGTPYVIQLLNP